MKLTKHMITEKEASLLLEKYYEGYSNSADEKRIAQFLRQKNLPPKFEADKAMFAYIDEKKSEKSDQKSRKLMPTLTWAASSAAAVLIAVFILFSTNMSNTNFAYVDGVKISKKKEIRALAQSSINNLTDNQDEILSNLKLVNQENIIEAQLELFK